jgi:hypothetical protein
MLEAGLTSLLLANTTIAGLIGTRLYPVIITLETFLDPNTETPPSISYRVISTVELQTNDGPVGCVKARIEYNCFAHDYADAKNLAEAVRNVINGFTGTLADGTVVSNAWRDNSTDGFDPDSRSYRVQADYFLIYAA